MEDVGRSMKIGDLVYCRNDNANFRSAGIITDTSDDGRWFIVHTFVDNKKGSWSIGYVSPIYV